MSITKPDPSFVHFYVVNVSRFSLSHEHEIVLYSGSGIPPGALFDPFGPPGVPGFEPDGIHGRCKSHLSPQFSGLKFHYQRPFPFIIFWSKANNHVKLILITFVH